MTNKNNNGWTDARRARQAELIKQWQPWLKSTGPKTKEGKEAAKMNAKKHGRYSAERLATRIYLTDWKRRMNEWLLESKKEEL